MIKAILLDLDNTLIENPDYQFARAFLEHIEAHYRDETGKTGAARGFRQGLNKLHTPLDADYSPIIYNQHVIVDQIASETKLAQQEASTLLEQFYASKYRELRAYIQPINGASELVKRLIDDGYSVIIATNPLYSQAATVDRMQWGNLVADVKQYALITSAETMHFSKPNPAYYAEIIAKVGVEPDEAIVVGDGPSNDIDAARQAGLFTYHITNGITHETADDGGRLDNFYRVLKNKSLWQNIPEDRLKPSMILPEYWGTLGALYGFLDHIQPSFWQQKPDQAEWSILQILCHLWQHETEQDRPRLLKILNETNPFIVAPNAPGPDIKICDDDGWFVARQFELERRKTISLLKSVSDEQWQRVGRHSIFGNTTLLEMAHFTAQHDRLHLNQLCETIGRCDKEK